MSTRIGGAAPFGLALIALGVVLILDNLEVVDATGLLAGWWPVAVVAAGLWWVFTDSTVTGVVVAVVGGLLLVSTLDLVEVTVGALILPGLLLVVGGAFVQAGARIRGAEVAMAGSAAILGGTGGTNGGRHVRANVATAVFGDARLAVSDGGTDRERLLVTATAVFGDVRVEVPAGWRIEDHLTRVLGDVTIPTDQPSYPESPLIALHGLVLLGDVHVHYVDLAEGVR